MSKAGEPTQDRIERLADRVFAVAKSLAGRSDGRTFTVDGIYDEMPEINRQRLCDAIKTLKDARRIHPIGRSKGIYEVEEAFPPKRKISITSMTDGWRLMEVGDEYAVAITPAEAAEIGGYLAGDAARDLVSEKIKALDSCLAEVRYENLRLRQQMRDVLKATKAQGDLGFSRLDDCSVA